MPRFHFDVIDTDILIDEEGVDFVDSATMEQEAMRAAGTMVSEKTRFPREPWKMVVRDETRKIVATLVFAAQ